MASILVVEDDTGTVALLEELLLEAGHEVRTASNGLDALSRLVRWRPHLILLDIMMPVMHGLTLCHYLNADPDLSTIPLIMMSDATNKPLLDHCRYHAFLDKPFQVDTLLTLVHSLLSNITE